MKLSSETKIINESVDQKLAKARELKSKNLYYEAIQMYHKVIFLKQDPQAISQLAEIYESLHDVSSALTFYKKSNQVLAKPRIKQKIKELTLVKGLNLISIGAIKNILHQTEFDLFTKRYQGFNKKLRAKADRLKTSNPRFSQHLLSCLAYLQVNHRKLALDELESCLIINEKDVDAMVIKGLIHWSLFQNKKGYESFWNAYSNNQENEEVKLFISMIMPQLEGLYKEAKYDLIDNELSKCKLKVKKGLDMHPHNTKFLILSSYLHRIKQQYEEALSDLDIANRTFDKESQKSEELQSQLRNQISLTYNEMGVYLFKQQKYNEAITLFDEGLIYSHKDPGILSNRGDCHRSMNDFIKALQDYEAAYAREKHNGELNFRIASIYNMRGIALFNSKNFQLAISQFNQSIKYTPQCEAFYLSKAKCLVQINQKSEAIRTLEIAQKTCSSNKEIIQFLDSLKETEDKKAKNQKKIIYLSKEKS